MFAGPNTDGWNADCLCDLLCDICDHNLQHDGKRARFFHSARIAHQRFCLRLITTLNPVATFLAHTLRQHTYVRHERDTCLCDRFDLRHMARTALELYRLCA